VKLPESWQGKSASPDSLSNGGWAVTPLRRGDRMAAADNRADLNEVGPQAAQALYLLMTKSDFRAAWPR